MNATLSRYYTPPSKAVERWSVQWLYAFQCWDSAQKRRATLAGQLRSIRKQYGTAEATAFRNRLIYIGVYPLKKAS